MPLTQTADVVRSAILFVLPVQKSASFLPQARHAVRCGLLNQSHTNSIRYWCPFDSEVRDEGHQRVAFPANKLAAPATDMPRPFG
jgi:hypothetical protein